MAMHKGPTPALMLIASRLANIHMAFTLTAYDDGTACLSCNNQATLDAAIEQQRNFDEDIDRRFPKRS
ncbi:hypothetical protein [Pseudomonas phage PMBT14]|uniref:Uncharacterized protein n=1 Tax=Pseudomonas phage PMBT14 TaxID=2059855 RepID=A0A2I6PI91_9CAUD|nr:hypothetical protein HWB42_gp60 [Pseudomonas phage PMBT14]AUM59778.1 hypothetical protein [Pseudomonas phage PMBT14]